MNKVTIVTGLWNIGRDKLEEGWSRSYEHYLEKFSELLRMEENMIIFGDQELENFVEKHRKKENTYFIQRDLDTFPSLKLLEIVNLLPQS